MSDTEDEVQDWSILTAGNESHSVLKRGEKDYEPDGTHGQHSVLATSRNAMYGALSYQPFHAAKNIVECDWSLERHQASVRRPKGTYFVTMGKAEKTVIWLQPEEVLYLVQRGSMQCFLDGAELDLAKVTGLCLREINPGKMLVYSYLKKLGYVVLRAPQSVPGFPRPHQHPPSLTCNNIMRVATSPWHQHLAWKSAYSTFKDIYRDLRFINTGHGNEAPAALDFYVWKPSRKFKKSQPVDPDYCVKIVDAQNAHVPSLKEARALFANLPAHKRTKNSATSRIKQGYRTIILAVVDSGVVSFVRLVDTEFENSININPVVRRR